jgi:hypothetical protein
MKIAKGKNVVVLILKIKYQQDSWDFTTSRALFVSARDHN